MRTFLLAFVITAAVTAPLTWVVYRTALRLKLHPPVRERDVHKTPKPRLGGVAMYLGMVAMIVISSQLEGFHIIWQEPQQMWALLGAATLMTAVGVADDILDLDWMIKLGAQFLAAWIVVGPGGIQIYALPFGDVVLISSWVSITLSVLVIVIVMNAVNFIDGLDGLVAGVCLIANGVFFAYTYLIARDLDNSAQVNLAAFLTVVVLGMCAGFLPINWNPARMFMGDAGALLLGLFMATAAISITGNLPPQMLSDNDVFGRSQLLGAFIPVILPIVVVSLPLLDFGMAVIRRMARGKSPFSPDRKHLHHRMLDMGHTDRNAVFVFYAWTAIVSLSVLLMYIGTTNGWPGLYWPGVAYLAVGVVACVVVTLPPARQPRRLRATDRKIPA